MIIYLWLQGNWRRIWDTASPPLLWTLRALFLGFLCAMVIKGCSLTLRIL